VTESEFEARFRQMENRLAGGCLLLLVMTMFVVFLADLPAVVRDLRERVEALEKERPARKG